jgi:glycosyltransferase involved in cell wall biosynthesis
MAVMPSDSNNTASEGHSHRAGDVLVTVVLCTWNPRRDVLARALDALAKQSLPADAWELLIIDNGSAPPVEMPEFPGAAIRCRVVVEPIVGLTSARIRGIREARGPLIVFVDDDNVLDRDYLATALNLAETRPDLGAFSGRVSPEFAVEPPAWLRPFHAYLALSDFDRDAWSTKTFPDDVLPCGAGMCIRRAPVEAWAQAVAADPRRLSLGRKGQSLLSAEDTDMALACIDQGYATGRFTALHLTHVIPAGRLEFDYLRRLARDLGVSYGRLLAMRGDLGVVARAKVWLRTTMSWLGLKYRGPARAIDLAYHRGFLEGVKSGSDRTGSAG